MANTIKWQRFSGHKDGAFLSMHREVAIGVLSLSMLSSFDAKAASVSVDSSAAGSAVAEAANSQKDSLWDDGSREKVNELEEVTVLSSRVPLSAKEAARSITSITSKEAAQTTAHTVNDLLKLAPGIDIRQRGAMGVQTDITMRGGTFDQTTLLLNGINISSAQTGHLSADFAISNNDIDHIEVIEGAAARIFGTRAFSGALNIVTRQGLDGDVSAEVFGGAFGLGGGSASVTKKFGNSTHYLSGGFTRCDGATDNSDFKQSKFFYHGADDGSMARTEWMAGYSRQLFGASTFYSPAFPNQFEETERLLLSLRSETKGRLHVSPAVYWLRDYDNFQLTRGSGSGENFHRNDTYGLNLNAWGKWALGRTSFGAEMRNEGILSTSLGRPVDGDSVRVHRNHSLKYGKEDNRTDINFYLEHNVQAGPLSVSAGLLANSNTALDEKVRLYPGVDLTLRPLADFKLGASWNKALRMPTWTDLYYKSPTQNGNTDLRPEEVQAFNFLAQYSPSGFSLSADVYHNRGKKMIDWVMYNESDIWHSDNFELNTTGLELQAAFDLERLLGRKAHLERFQLLYEHIWQERKDSKPIFKSNYAMEFLRDRFVASLSARLLARLHASFTLRSQKREGGYLAYGPDHKPTGEICDYGSHTLADAKLWWQDKLWSVYLEADNISDERYFDLGNIEQPGLWVKAGLKVNLNVLGRRAK